MVACDAIASAVAWAAAVACSSADIACKVAWRAACGQSPSSILGGVASAVARGC